MSERVAYATGTTVASNWLNHAVIREMVCYHFIVHKETASGVSTTYGDAMTPGGVSSTDSGNPNPGSVIQNAINNS